MQTISLIFGILAGLGMFIAFFPCLGSFNWINIPFAILGLIISIIAYTQGDPVKRGGSKAGIILCSIAVVFGGIRLLMGGGIV